MTPAAARLAAQTAPSPDAFHPVTPRNSMETGLDRTFLSNLILKTAYHRNELVDYDLAETLCLPYSVIEEHVAELRRENLLEIAGTAASALGSYRLRITERGCIRARQVVEISQYVGPAPVSLEQYVAGLTQQTAAREHGQHERLHRVLSSLVLPRSVLEQIGPAFESGRALFLHGEPGNGKTALAGAIGAAFTETLLIPHAVEVDGQVIKLLDPIFHGTGGVAATIGNAFGEPLSRGVADRTHPGGAAAKPAGGRTRDERWVAVKRPVVFVGGELNLDMLDLTFNDREGVYEAPLHMKANGGALIIDDFGRQLVKPRDLLNRWIVPLDKNVDFLTLHTGKKFPIPFRTMVIFATNLNPRDLVDEAFLRRIPYKVELKPPSREEYREIFLRECKAAGVEASSQAIEYIYRRYYEELGVPVRACHPRDLLRNLLDIARWNGGPPKASPQNLELVCRSYFLGA